MKDRFGVDWGNLSGVPFWRRPVIGRRLFFRHLGAAVGGWFLLPGRPMEVVAKAAVPARGTAKNCIFILMAGAPSHIDTFDLKEGPWTPASFNPTSFGDIRFPQGLFPKLADQMDSLVFLRSVRAWAAVHFLAQAWVQLGRNPLAGTSRTSPHIGSVVAMELGPRDDPTRVLPAFVSLNAGGGNPENGYFPPQTAPFYVNPNGGGLPNTTHRDGPARLDARYGLLQKLDTELRDTDPNPLGPALPQMAQFNVSARTLMYNSAVDQVFNFSADERQRYGNTAFGNACITARNLLRASLGTRFIQISLGGWDNHVGIYQPNVLPNLARQFDSGLGALIADLKAGGLLDQTLILAMGEFGRTVGPLNAQSGRDHYLQQTALFAGGGLRGGRVVGATDDKGSATTDPGWSRQRDVKPEDIEATLYSALGIDWTTVRHDDPLKRGFEYVPFSPEDLYGPVDELWG